MTKLSLETKKLKLTLMKFLSFYNNFLLLLSGQLRSNLIFKQISKKG
jgi:hypothetical protein